MDYYECFRIMSLLQGPDSDFWLKQRTRTILNDWLSLIPNHRKDIIELLQFITEKEFESKSFVGFYEELQGVKQSIEDDAMLEAELESKDTMF